MMQKFFERISRSWATFKRDPEETGYKMLDKCPSCGSKELDPFMHPDEERVISQVCRSCGRRAWIDESLIPLA